MDGSAADFLLDLKQWKVTFRTFVLPCVHLYGGCKIMKVVGYYLECCGMISFWREEIFHEALPNALMVSKFTSVDCPGLDNDRIEYFLIKLLLITHYIPASSAGW